MGELRRMTQFKEKSEGRDSVSADLFTYPVLQAADILLYKADRCRSATTSASTWSWPGTSPSGSTTASARLFPLPEAAIPSSGGRVMDLQEPTRKMSTTRGTPQGTVLVIDPPEVVSKKMRSPSPTPAARCAAARARRGSKT